MVDSPLHSAKLTINDPAIVPIALTTRRRPPRDSQRIQAGVVSDSTPKISRIFWQVISGQVDVQLTLRGVQVLELAGSDGGK